MINSTLLCSNHTNSARLTTERYRLQHLSQPPSLRAEISTALSTTAVCSVVWLLTSAAAVADTRVQVSAGADYTTGKFGSTDTTTIVQAPIALKLSNGNWSLRASVPYVSIRGPANVTVLLEDNGGSGSNSGSGSSGSGSSGSGSGGSGSGSSGGSNDNTTTTRSSQRTLSGPGDTSIAATYSFNRIADSALYVDVTGRVRLPTGNERNGISLGVTDYAAQLELGIDLDAGGVYASGGRRFLGNTSSVQRVDGWQASGGAWLNLGEHSVLGAYADWRQSSTVGNEDPTEVGGYFTLSLSRHWKLELDASTPMNSSGADYTAGATLIWRAFGYGK